MAFKLPKFMNPMPRTKSYQELAADAWYEFHSLAQAVQMGGMNWLVTEHEPGQYATPEEIQQATKDLRRAWRNA